MNINEDKLDALREERKQCLARIEQIDRILDAVRVLVNEDLIPESDMIQITVTQLANTPNGNHKRAAKVAARNDAVWSAIEKSGKHVFTVPGVSRKTKIDKRRTKRAIDYFIEKGKVAVSTPGYKSRATTYKLIQTK